ncbi:AcrR family transcriptional regulator [Rhodococcus sp. LBL1]|nr:AcrR family transcriptional regulator [Rhodococcus sp. LBL1]MDH6681726.1 AcrR family transcriptional regulator [Rhodococcus sp. LBL2]
MNANAPRVGRPRDPGKDHAVLVAARGLLGEVGYQQTTLMAIARRAEVSTPAIYRRWPSREALIEDAIHGPAADGLPEATDDLRADLRSWASVFVARASSPAARAGIPGLLGDARSDVDRARLLARQAPAFESFAARLELAAERGEILAPVDASILFEILIGTTSVHGLVKGGRESDTFAAALGDALHVLACHGSGLDTATEAVRP